MADDVSLSPGSPAELGAGLRALRTMGLRRLAARQGSSPGALVLSKSQLARYEGGEVLPPLEYAEHLDVLYQGEGWVELSIRTLWRPKWNPWRLEHGSAGRYHAGRWPAEHGGLVWIKIKPLPKHVNMTHEIDLEWGPWRRHVTCSLPGRGIVLATGKGRDPDHISRVCNITTDPAVFTLYGAGESLTDENVLDIRRGWQKVNDQASEDAAQYGPARED